MSFSDMKKRMSQVDRLTQEINKTQNKSESYKDDRFWKPTQDQAGNGYAVIRFLPACEGEEVPWARVFSHGFQGKGGWFIENCPTTIGKKCPVCEANNELWNSGIESDKEIARDRKRKLSYISNIIVMHDPANPENEGKIFLFKYGKKIFDKITESMQPEFEDETPINPFDFWEGANFKLKIRKVAGYVNYDKSEFESASALYEGKDSLLEPLWKNQYPLNEFTDVSNFKDYTELTTKLDSVLGDNPKETHYESKSAEDVAPKDEDFTPKFNRTPDVSSETEDIEEEDALSYFEKLASED